MAIIPAQRETPLIFLPFLQFFNGKWDPKNVTLKFLLKIKDCQLMKGPRYQNLNCEQIPSSFRVIKTNIELD